MSRFLPALCFFAFFTGIFVACQPSAPAPKASANGHQRMIAILDSIARNASPDDCYNLNSRKAEQLRQRLENAPPDQQPSIRFQYADQLLRAGKNEEAILQLLEVQKTAGPSITPQNKIVYEFLALAYMRLGEQANCINTHTPESCILPIAGEGIYKMPSGPENAVKIYEEILKVFPDDLQNRWLLNLAYMTLGRWPEGVPAAFRLPASTFAQRGPIRFPERAIPLGIDRRGISGGACMEDFDNDGRLDLFVTSYGLTDQCHFYHNNGDGSFADRTAAANLNGITSGLNAIHADYDNDGDRDVLILRGAWLTGGTHPNSLLRNNGDGTFTDVTIEAGLLSFHPTQAADWADFDGDGWLDLYIANETQDPSRLHYNELYHNNGDGTFTDVAARLRVNFFGFYKAAVWGDINNDQRPDLYLSNVNGDNKLLINRGGTSVNDWRFDDAGIRLGVQNPQKSFPAFFFDYDNDGYQDIFCSSYVADPREPSATPYFEEVVGKQAKGDWICVYHNNGNETFTNLAPALGLNSITYAMGNGFGDLDNDGWPDIYLGTGKPDLRSLIPNRMFHNLGGKKFEDLSMNGFGHIQKGHGVAFGDLDGDGDQDLYVVVGGAFEGDLGNNIYFENPGNGNAWVTLFLEGKTCNRDAMNARIKVNTVQKNGAKRAIYATVGTDGSFGSGSLRQEIGLGQAVRIESVEVQWPKPGVANSVYLDVPLNSAVKLVEGNGKFENLKI